MCIPARRFKNIKSQSFPCGNNNRLTLPSSCDKITFVAYGKLAVEGDIAFFALSFLLEGIGKRLFAVYSRTEAPFTFSIIFHEDEGR